MSKSFKGYASTHGTLCIFEKDISLPGLTQLFLYIPWQVHYMPSWWGAFLWQQAVQLSTMALGFPWTVKVKKFYWAYLFHTLPLLLSLIPSCCPDLSQALSRSSTVQFSSVAQSSLLFGTPWTAAPQASLCITSSSSLLRIHVHRVVEAMQPSHPLSSLSPPAFNLSQHQSLFQWSSSSHQVAKVLELQLQYQSFQWIFRTDFL